MTFIQQIKPKPGETVVFSWIVYKSKAHRDRVNAKVMKDPRLAKMMDPKRDAVRHEAHGVRRVQGLGEPLSSWVGLGEFLLHG